MKQTNQQKKHFVTIIVLAFSQVTETEKWGGRKVFGMFLSFLFPTEQIEKRLCPLSIMKETQNIRYSLEWKFFTIHSVISILCPIYSQRIKWPLNEIEKTFKGTFVG